jgi:hypothetical protein
MKYKKCQQGENDKYGRDKSKLVLPYHREHLFENESDFFHTGL